MRNAKVDLTQRAIVKALRDIGASVQVLSTVGQGVPDLLVGWHGKSFCIETKTGKGKLTEAQQKWHASWSGHVAVVRTPEEAQMAIIEAGK